MLCYVSSEKSQFEFSIYQKVNERVELSVLSTWSAACDVSTGTFALAGKYTPSTDRSVKVRPASECLRC